MPLVLKSCYSCTLLTRSAFFSLSRLCLIQAVVWLRRRRGNYTWSVCQTSMWSYIPPFMSERSHKSLLKVSMTDFCTCMGTHGSLLERACANTNSISTAFHCAGVIPLPAESNRHGNGRVLTSRQEHLIFRLVFRAERCLVYFPTVENWNSFTMYNATFQVEESLLQFFIYVGKDQMVQRSMVKLGEGWEEELTSNFKWLILI